MQAKFSKIEKQKAALLQMVEGWSVSRLTYRPAAASWSALEVFDHIVKVESAILAEAQCGRGTPHQVGLSDRIRFVLLELLFKSPARVKVPASAPQVLPQPDTTIEEIAQRWSAVRTDLSATLDVFQPEQSSLGIFRHPVSGWMTMDYVIRFFSVHILHHRFQLLRLEAESRTKSLP